MYIWVLLATFITLLFSFNLGVRSDMKELYVDTQAATVASKMYVQHKAAEEYLKATIKNFKKGMGPAPHFMELTEDVAGNDLREALAKHATVPNFSPATGAHTILYCVNRDGFDEPFFNKDGTQCQQVGDIPAAELGCCSGIGNDGKALKYLVTVVPVPIRWQARNAKGEPINSPNGSMMNALKNVSSKKLGFGYMIYDGENFYIKGVSDEPMMLYKEIGVDLTNNYGCGVSTNPEDKKAFCMIFADSL